MRMSVVPEPIDWEVELLYEDSPGFVPHSNQAVLGRPFGLTFPLQIAPVVMRTAGRDVEIGAEVPKVVEKLIIDPFRVPEAFVAATR